MRHSVSEQPQPESIFGSAFNLHPLDSLAFLQNTYTQLQEFTEGFKERIEAEIQYSKALIKVSKILAKHVNPARPSPISYISSAFKVEHELRARHALELAEYLHTEIEIPCESLLQDTEYKLKQMGQDLKKQYKEGENVEETYQKYLKKYYRSRQDWQERMISKTILVYAPGVSQSQLEKANTKLQEQKEQNTQLFNKYLSSLQNFNKFAQKFNDSITEIIILIEKQSKKLLALESNCLRKLIVSEINMFKNIEYDMINISKQMENIQPSDQLQIYMQESGPVFQNPIISIYSDGPILQNNWHSIDFKCPISRSLLEETLLRIQRKHFTWMLENKHNSTLKYALTQAWNKFEGREGEDFMEDLEDCVINNKTVKQLAINNTEKEHYLNSDQAFSVSFSIITNLASFIRPLQLTQNKQTEIIELLRSYLTLHHFYRFFAATSLEQFLNLRQNLLTQKIQQERLVMIVKLLIQQCVAAKDIFVVRSILAIMFSTELGPNRVPLYSRSELLDFDIWSNNDFWQSILFEATYEEITLLPSVVKAELRQIYLMRQKNIVFSTLATYCHYMIMVGCELQQVKEIAGRFCHIYGLYDEHERDLSKMIKSSTERLNKLNNRLSQINKDQKSQVEAQSNSNQITKIQNVGQTQIIQESTVNQLSIQQPQPSAKSSQLQEQKKQEQNKQQKSTNQNLQFQKAPSVQPTESAP